MVALHRDDAPSPPGPLSAPQRGGVGERRARLSAITSRDIPLPRVPKSSLPDGAIYEDTGCEFAPSCLACPFAACKYDDPEVFKLDAARRDREIARLRRDHRVPIEALMRTYGLSRTHVYRALREHGVTRAWVDRDGQSKTLRYDGKPGAKRRRGASSRRPHIAIRRSSADTNPSVM